MDIKVEINDTVLAKITESAKYPVVVLDYDKPFEIKSLEENLVSVNQALDEGEVNNFIDTIYGESSHHSEFYNSLEKEEKEEADKLVKEVYNEVIQAITACVNSYDNVKAGKVNGRTLEHWEWPEGIPAGDEGRKAMMEMRLEEPGALLKNNSIVSVKTHLRRAKIELMKAPSVKFQSGKIDIDNVDLRSGARVELWVSYKWPNCYRWCTQWRWVTKWAYTAITINDIKVKAAADVPLATSGNVLTAGVKFQDLRLDHNLVDWINLAPVANNFLSDKVVKIYDANKFIQTIPVIEKEFRISKFEVISGSNLLTTGLEIQKI